MTSSGRRSRNVDDPNGDGPRALLRPTGDLPPRRPCRRPVDVDTVDASLLPLVDRALDHLSERLGVTRDVVVVEAAGSVTWSDGSCGCPEPGKSYAQTPVDGVYVRLSAAGRCFHYHGGGRRPLFLCDW